MTQPTFTLTTATAFVLLPLRLGINSCIECGLLPRRLFIYTVTIHIAQGSSPEGKAERPYRH